MSPLQVSLLIFKLLVSSFRLYHSKVSFRKTQVIGTNVKGQRNDHKIKYIYLGGLQINYEIVLSIYGDKLVWII